MNYGTKQSNLPSPSITVNDASGRYAGGLWAGNQHRLVHRSLCDELNEETEVFYSDIQRNIVNVSKIVPYPVQTVIVKYQAVVLNRKQKVLKSRFDYLFMKRIIKSNILEFMCSTDRLLCLLFTILWPQRTVANLRIQSDLRILLVVHWKCHVNRCQGVKDSMER